MSSTNPEPGFVVIQSAALPVPLKILLGEGAPKVTSGYAQYDEIERPRRRSAVEFKNMTSVRMDIPLLIDSWVLDLGDVETTISYLERLAVTGSPLKDPPTIQIAGPIPYPSETWFVTDLQWGDTVIYDGMVRRRQDVVMSVVQANLIDLILRDDTRRPVRSKKGYRIVVIKQGMDLRKLASIMLGTATRWRQILNMKGKPFRYPTVKVGTHVKVPRE